MRKRTGRRRQRQGFRQIPSDQLKDFQEPKTIDELLGIFAEHGEEIEVAKIEAIFRQSGRERMSVLELTARLIDRQKGERSQE